MLPANLPFSNLDLATTVLLTRTLLTIGLLTSALEGLSRISNFRPDGLFSWEVFSTQYPTPRTKIVANSLRILFGASGVRAMLIVQSVCLVLMIIPGLAQGLYTAPICIVLLIRLAFTYRCSYGTDGSDQMDLMVLSGLFATALLNRSVANQSTANQFSQIQFGLWFIALQSVLSYTTSGISKIFSHTWMSGQAAFKIFNTYTYGIQPVAAFFQAYDRAAMVLCWGIVGYETVFPITLLASTNLLMAFLLFGIVFHLFNALVMGLNKFLWSFVATYPAIIFCNHQITSRFHH